jgi:hypothetical protein
MKITVRFHGGERAQSGLLLFNLSFVAIDPQAAFALDHVVRCPCGGIALTMVTTIGVR